MEVVKEKTKEFTGLRKFKADDMVQILEGGVKEQSLKFLPNDHIESVAKDREANGKCITGLVDGVIVGCGGIEDILPDVAEVWVLLSYQVDNYPIHVFEVIRDGLQKLIEDNNLRRVESWCRVNFAKGHTLLRHLNFKVEGKALGRAFDGTDMILYARINKNVRVDRLIQ